MREATTRKHGKKYLAVTSDGAFGPTIYYFNSIKELSKFDREDVQKKRLAIWRAHNGAIYRVGADGKLPPEVLKRDAELNALADSSDPRLA